MYYLVERDGRKQVVAADKLWANDKIIRTVDGDELEAHFEAMEDYRSELVASGCTIF